MLSKCIFEQDLNDFNRIRVLDGGFGSELERIGFKVEDDPLWSAAAIIDRPLLVVDVHKRFIEAGCDVILTNSYQANIEVMMKSRGMNRAEAEDVLKKSIRLAHQAVNESSVTRRIQVVGSVGSYATTFHDGSEYTGKYIDEVNEKLIVNYYINQCLPLIDAGIGMIAFETIPSLKEAKCVLEALDSLPGSLKCWISFSCKNGDLINYGESFAESVKAVSVQPKVVAVGINCTEPRYITPLLKSAVTFLNGKYFAVYPNNGDIFDNEAKRWIPSSYQWSDFANEIPKWVALGAKLVGGCCRVYPENIREISNVIAFLS